MSEGAGWIRSIGRWLRNYFVVVGVLATLLPILFTVMVVRAGSRGEKAPAFRPEQPALIVLKLEGPLAERAPDFTDLLFSQLFGEEPKLYLPELRTMLRKAGADERVAGLELQIGALEGTAAEIVELRRILEDFKGTGKQISAVLHHGFNWNYYLASVADKIALNPAESIFIPGPAITLTYFGEALRKIGVDIEVIRAGRFKSAFEPFIQNAPSEATLEQYRSLERHLREHMVKTVAAGRGKPESEVAEWFKQSIFRPDDALARGLVDEIGYGPEGLTEIGKDGKGQSIAGDKYARVAREMDDVLEVASGQGGIALIEAIGEIVMDDNSGNPDVITPSRLARQLRWAARDDDVQAVVLRVASPGGSAVASDMIWKEMKNLVAKKPVVVSMGSVAASGGYYISAPASKILAEPTTITGSIGVIGATLNLEAFKEKYGVSFYIVTESDRAALLDPGRKSTGLDKQLVESTIESVYQIFLEKVAQGRGKTVEEVASLAEGRVYTGIEAQKLGLVDELGGLHEAFQMAKELASLDKNKLYPVLTYQGEGLSLRECLRNPARLPECLGTGTRLGLQTLVPEIDLVASRVVRWTDILRKERVLALWPGYAALEQENEPRSGKRAGYQ